MVDSSRCSRVSGLESFFTAPDRADGPSRTRLTVLTIAVVFGLQLVVQAVVAPWVGHGPLVLRALFYAVVLVLVLVLALGYVFMPFLTRRSPAGCGPAPGTEPPSTCRGVDISLAAAAPGGWR